MIRAVLPLLAVLVGCHDAAVDRPTPVPEEKPADRMPAKLEPVTSFPILSKEERGEAARRFASELGAETVGVDYAGYVKHVVFALPREVPEAERVAYVQAVIREHAAAFGVVDARQLPYVIEEYAIRFGAGTRWTGQISARFEERTLTISGHLWPIATEAIAREPAELEALVSPYYGKKGAFLSRCKEECNKDQHFTLDRHSFGFVPGMALICDGDHLEVRAAIAIAHHWKAGSRISGGTPPRLVDARTLEVIARDFYMPV